LTAFFIQAYLILLSAFSPFIEMIIGFLSFTFNVCIALYRFVYFEVSLNPRSKFHLIKMNNPFIMISVPLLNFVHALFFYLYLVVFVFMDCH
jgi:hypothetical protein